MHSIGKARARKRRAHSSEEVGLGAWAEAAGEGGTQPPPAAPASALPSGRVASLSVGVELLK